MVWMGLHVVAGQPLRHFRACNGAAPRDTRHWVAHARLLLMDGPGRHFLVYFRRESSYFTEVFGGMKEMSVLVTACILYIRQYQSIRHSGKSYSLSVWKGNEKQFHPLENDDAGLTCCCLCRQIYGLFYCLDCASRNVLTICSLHGISLLLLCTNRFDSFDSRLRNHTLTQNTGKLNK